MAIATIRSAAALSVLIGIAVQLFLASALAPARPTGDTMSPGETLLSGKSLSSGEYSLTMQEDCNLVLRRAGKVTWESNTAGKGTECFMYLQTNGLLLVSSKGEGGLIWKSETVQSSAGDRFKFVLQPEGNAVVLSNNTPVWSTASKGKK